MRDPHGTNKGLRITDLTIQGRRDNQWFEAAASSKICGPHMHAKTGSLQVQAAARQGQGIFYAVFVVLSPDLSHTCNIQSMEQEQCKLTGETSSDSQGRSKMEFREPGQGDMVQDP